MTVALSTRLGSRVDLANPVMTAAGVAGFSTELAGYFDIAALGAFVTKSLAHFETRGNPAPRVVGAGAAMLNSVGLTGPGIAAWRESDARLLERSKVKTIVSIWGRTIADYRRAIVELQGCGDFVVGVEINVSCPNLEDRNKMFAHSVSAVREIMDATSLSLWPRFVKLSPNTHLLAEVIDACRTGGADGVVLINTAMGLSLDRDLLAPSLGAKGGGMSGPALRAIAVRAIYESYANWPDLPIVGVGGIATSADAVEAIAAGASAIQVGTASFVEPRAAMKVLASLPSAIEKLGFSSISQLVGAAHRGGIAATKRMD